MNMPCLVSYRRNEVHQQTPWSLTQPLTSTLVQRLSSLCLCSGWTSVSTCFSDFLLYDVLVLPMIFRFDFIPFPLYITSMHSDFLLFVAMHILALGSLILAYISSLFWPLRLWFLDCGHCILGLSFICLVLVFSGNFWWHNQGEEWNVYVLAYSTSIVAD